MMYKTVLMTTNLLDANDYMNELFIERMMTDSDSHRVELSQPKRLVVRRHHLNNCSLLNRCN